MPDTLPAGELEFLSRDGCAATAAMRANLDAALSAAGQPLDYQFIDLAQLPPDDPRVGYPTPTVLHRGKDLYGMPVPAPPFPQPT